MKFLIDTHTHTLASGHAYSTISEMVQAASEKGLKMLAITEHATAMPGTCGDFYFHNLRVVRRNQLGIELLMGVELNIIDYEGKIDMDEYSLSGLDLAIASMHMPCIKPGTIEENTNAYIGAMKNKYVHIIGHPDDSRYPVDYRRLVQAAKEHKVALEVNNSSLNPNGFRQNTRENIINMLTLCKEYETPITLGSDAHVMDDVGNISFTTEVLELTDFPEELILNTSIDKFKSYLGVGSQTV